MPGRLEGRIAIVTGSDSGMGRATAAAFAREGADVVITYLEDEAGAAETDRLVKEFGRRAMVRRCDQREFAAVAALFGAVQEELGIPDILVNNAGVSGAGMPIDEVEPAAWEQTIRANLFGPFYFCREFVRARKRRGGDNGVLGGKIINITSVHEEIPDPGGSDYVASKGGLRNLTRTLALELAPVKINVNAIAPGMVLTPMNQKAMDDMRQRERQTRNIPWKRAARPEEIAELAVYLASDDADFVTGQSFTIDGGQQMNWGQGA